MALVSVYTQMQETVNISDRDIIKTRDLDPIVPNGKTWDWVSSGPIGDQVPSFSSPNNTVLLIIGSVPVSMLLYT